MRQIFYHIFFVSVLAVTISSQTLDKYELHQLKALEGVTKFGVYVWDIKGYHEDSSLTVADVEKFVHRALKPFRIKTVSFSDSRGLPGTPNLEVQIRVHQKRNKNSYVYNLILRFIQDVKLERNNFPFYSAIVWERDDLGHAELADLNLEIKISLNSLLDEFVKDYKRINKL